VRSLNPGSAAAARGSRLAAVAASQPEAVVSAADLGAPFGKSADWIRARTGIDSLRRLGPDEQLLPHAADASAKALAQLALTPDAVDLFITASCSVNMSPTIDFAAGLASELGLDCARMELNAACAGFSYALGIADAQIRSGMAQTVLIAAAEQMSTLIDPSELGTSILFADGAGAAVVVPADRPEIGPTAWGSTGDTADVLVMDAEGYLRMKGSDVFRWAVATAPQVALEACERAGLHPEDIDVFVPHQANLRIDDAVAQRLGLREDVVIATDVTESGNTSAASIPIALSKLRERGAYYSGARALLVGFGAGLTYSGQVVVLP
jgi:3-oxoacyl-[acyl-carrier-protein] synthase-3